jgi:hypothetical protein
MSAKIERRPPQQKKGGDEIKHWLNRAEPSATFAETQAKRIAALKAAIGAEAWTRLLASGRTMSAPFAMALFQPKEEALVRLALNDAASVGEQDNAARALIRSLRARGVDPEALITGKELEQKAIKPWSDPGSTIMPWGKYVGRPLSEIDPAYLRWVLRKCSKAAICPTIRDYLKLLQRS